MFLVFDFILIIRGGGEKLIATTMVFTQANVIEFTFVSCYCNYECGYVISSLDLVGYK